VNDLIATDEEPRDHVESTTSDGVTSTGTGKRKRGGIAFPYDDLDAAVAIAGVLHHTFGGSANTDQIAAAMGQNPASGSFTAKMGAARHFGLATTSKGAMHATSLGRRILSDNESQAARTEAFLNVPLYAALYEAYRGTQLPSDAGLEAKILALGAPEKQVKTARQVFARSARQAGFFDISSDRLVKPAAGSITAEESADDQIVEEKRSSEIGMKPALITEVFKRLPDEGKPFTPEDRERWMAALKASLDLEYASPVASTRTIGERVTPSQQRQVHEGQSAT